MRTVLALTLALSALAASSQEFKPFRHARVTSAQWQAYFDEVSSKHGSTRQEMPAERLVAFSDSATSTTYAFTQSGHPAHPAWITRQVVQQGTSVNVRQIGYFSGEQPPFAQLYRAFQQLNDRVREELQRRNRQGKND